MITSLPSTPSAPKYDVIPKGEVILIHGLPKAGKTTFAATYPNNCIIEVEKSGAKWIKGAYVVEPENLQDIDQIIKLLRANKKFETVTLDTVDTLSLWIEKYICQKHGVTSISLATRPVFKQISETILDKLIDDDWAISSLTISTTFNSAL